MNLQICISGPSGVGKSTLAKHLSEQYDIPFITCSTKPLWDKHGIASHEELIKKGTMDPKWGYNFQYEVLKFRIESLSGHPNFITDRSPLDNMVYFLLQNCHLCTQKETEDYAKSCNEAMKMFTGIICLPFTPQTVLEDDGKRIVNRHYQMLVNNTFTSASFLMKQSLKDITGDTILIWEWDKRVEQAKKLLDTIKSK